MPAELPPWISVTPAQFGEAAATGERINLAKQQMAIEAAQTAARISLANMEMGMRMQQAGIELGMRKQAADRAFALRAEDDASKKELLKMRMEEQSKVAAMKFRTGMEYQSTMKKLMAPVEAGGSGLSLQEAAIKASMMTGFAPSGLTDTIKASMAGQEVKDDNGATIGYFDASGKQVLLKQPKSTELTQKDKITMALDLVKADTTGRTKLPDAMAQIEASSSGKPLTAGGPDLSEYKIVSGAKKVEEEVLGAKPKPDAPVPKTSYDILNKQAQEQSSLEEMAASRGRLEKTTAGLESNIETLNARQEEARRRIEHLKDVIRMNVELARAGQFGSVKTNPSISYTETGGNPRRRSELVAKAEKEIANLEQFIASAEVVKSQQFE